MIFRYVTVILVFLVSIQLHAEPLRIMLAATHDVSISNPEGTTTRMSYIDSVAIKLGGDLRFLRGVQLDLTSPQKFLSYRGSLAAVFYRNLSQTPQPGVADVNADQVSIEVIPDKIQNTWQIPLRTNHGLRSSPYVIIPVNHIPASSFPILFRIMPVFKGISDELENMVFQLHVRPILGDEGAIRLKFQYPEKLKDQPIMTLIDDNLLENPGEELLLKEGEHHLVVLSEHYRSINRRFIVEKAKVIDLLVELQDPTPLLIFESPENARIFVDNVAVANPSIPYPVEPGHHEVRFQVSDYSIVRPVTVQWGKTYKIALSVDVDITEND